MPVLPAHFKSFIIIPANSSINDDSDTPWNVWGRWVVVSIFIVLFIIAAYLSYRSRMKFWKMYNGQHTAIPAMAEGNAHGGQPAVIANSSGPFDDSNEAPPPPMYNYKPYQSQDNGAAGKTHAQVDDQPLLSSNPSVEEDPFQSHGKEEYPQQNIDLHEPPISPPKVYISTAV